MFDEDVAKLLILLTIDYLMTKGYLIKDASNFISVISSFELIRALV